MTRTLHTISVKPEIEKDMTQRSWSYSAIFEYGYQQKLDFLQERPKVDIINEQQKKIERMAQMMTEVRAQMWRLQDQVSKEKRTD